MGYFSPLNRIWPFWMSSPNARTAAIPCIAPDNELDQYDLCIAYLFDIEARTRRFQRDYSWIKIHPVWLENINEDSNVEKLFLELGILPSRRTRAVVGKTINSRENRKKELSIKTTLQECQRRIELYMQKAQQAGITLSEIPVPPRSKKEQLLCSR